MKKGISIWSFPGQSLKENFMLAKDAGFDGVEVALDEAGEISLHSTDRDLQAVKKSAGDAGISLYSVASGLYWSYCLNDEDPQVRAKARDIVKKQLETAAALGCDTILVIPGCVHAAFADPNRIIDYRDTYNRSLDAIQELSGYAESLRVNIGLENVWNKFLLSPMEMSDFIDKVNSPYVGSYLDIGNTLLTGFPEHWIRILGNKIKKIHFKDYRVDAGGLHGFVDLLAGDVNYPAVMTALKEIGYDDWVSAEMIPNYKYYTDTIIYNTSNAMDRILGRK